MCGDHFSQQLIITIIIYYIIITVVVNAEMTASTNAEMQKTAKSFSVLIVSNESEIIGQHAIVCTLLDPKGNTNYY